MALRVLDFGSETAPRVVATRSADAESRALAADGKRVLVTTPQGVAVYDVATPDRLPYLGKAPVDGLIVATGHYRNGILLAPITAEIVADLLAGQPPAVDLAPFDPQRVPEAIESAG